MSLQHPLGLSCAACRTRKRRCDKRQPRCSLCARKSLPCIYTSPSASIQRHNPELLRHLRVFEQTPPSLIVKRPHSTKSPDENTAHLQKPLHHNADFPSVFFVDSQISREYHVEIPKVTLPIVSCVRSIIGDTSHQHAIAKFFFETIYEWMPIIPKKRFYEHINPLCVLSADYALLILSMDLISWVPGCEAQDLRTATYRAAKAYYLDLEIAGAMSVQILQAGILIALFELGHAIYPSAFLSVASCARYASALGIGWRTASGGESPIDWVNLEERNRSWWAIVLLDRIINVGRPEKPLLIPTPGLNVILPGNDTDWDQGYSRTLYSVATPAIEWGDMGPFALVAQATRLLGLVLSHTSTPHALDEEEAILLHRTLKSLSEVVVVEGQLQSLHMLNQQAICSIALILLHESHASLPPSSKTKTSTYFAANHHIKTCASGIKKSMSIPPTQMPIISCVRDSCPFLVTLMYRSACVEERIHREEPTAESAENLDIIRSGLELFETRWKSAGVCRKALEAREMFYKR